MLIPTDTDLEPTTSKFQSIVHTLLVFKITKEMVLRELMETKLELLTISLTALGDLFLTLQLLGIRLPSLELWIDILRTMMITFPRYHF